METGNGIIIADDHPLFRSALRQIISAHFPQTPLHEAHDLSSLQSLMEQQEQADLILLDLMMPGAEGFSGLVFLLAHYPHIPVMVISAHEEPEIIRRAIDHGASGFLPKSSEETTMKQAIDVVLAGGVWMPENVANQVVIKEAEQNVADAISLLTPQQFRVASMVTQGLLNKQIAYELDVTEATVKAHMTEIFKKLNVHSRTQVALAFSHLSISDEASLSGFHS